MASAATKERNRATKGRTGPLTQRQRKRRGMKAKLHKKGNSPQGFQAPNTSIRTYPDAGIERVLKRMHELLQVGAT